MNTLRTIWKFSRPHTVIGSAISIFTLYVIICGHAKNLHVPLLLAALTIGVTCNVFIVGINQIADVAIDRINKPYLPIAAGTLSIFNAKFITYSALLISLTLALLISPYLFSIILLSAAIGWAYSMPPLHLKKHYLTAALSITFVRGVLINIGGFLVFNYEVNKLVHLPNDVKILSAFIIVFSMVIAWFKDLPDMEGDSAHGIKTLALAYSPRRVFIAGTVLILLTYLLTISFKYLELVNVPSFRAKTLCYGNIFLMLLFILNSFTVNLNIHASVKKFYKRFWWFFFAEYLLYLVAYLF